MNKYETRNDVPLKYKWDLTDIFKNIDDFNKTADEVREEIKKIDNAIEFFQSTSEEEVQKYLSYKMGDSKKIN